MVPAAVRHRLNQHRAVVGQRNPARLLGCAVDSARITSINTDGWDAVRWATAGDAVTCDNIDRDIDREQRDGSARWRGLCCYAILTCVLLMQLPCNKACYSYKHNHVPLYCSYAGVLMA